MSNVSYLSLSLKSFLCVLPCYHKKSMIVTIFHHKRTNAIILNHHHLFFIFLNYTAIIRFKYIEKKIITVSNIFIHVHTLLKHKCCRWKRDVCWTSAVCNYFRRLNGVGKDPGTRFSKERSTRMFVHQRSLHAFSGRPESPW